jgi:endonuclease-3
LVSARIEKLHREGRRGINADQIRALVQVAVDARVRKVIGRFFSVMLLRPDVVEVEEKLLKFTPPEFLQNAHHWLILHGRYVCLARKPGCPQCLIRDLCEFRPKTK